MAKRYNMKYDWRHEKVYPIALDNGEWVAFGDYLSEVNDLVLRNENLRDRLAKRDEQVEKLKAEIREIVDDER